jgi:uncharacterized coiled-coil protein SlyX
MERRFDQLEERIGALEQTLSNKLDRLRRDVAAGRTVAEETRDAIDELRHELADALNRRRSRTAV